MIRPSCSYWLNVSGPEEAVLALHSALKREDIVPSILDGEPHANPDGCLSAAYELNEKIGGAMDQWTDAADTFQRLSQEFPDTVIELREQCEELFTPTVYTTFKNGAAEAKFGRALDPDELDTRTIVACTDLLHKQGFGKIADMVEKGLKERRG